MNRRLADRALPLLRIYIGGNALVAWNSAVNNPDALLYRVAAESPNSMNLIWSAAAFGLAIILDLVINDILPKRFTWQKALKYRHFLLLAISFCYIAQLFVGSKEGRVLHLLIYNLWNASVILAAAFVDAKYRSRNLPCVMSYN